jgi:hypothetical protein
MQAITSWADIAFSSTERDRHLEIRPVSQLNTWPMVSPANASRRPSRDAAHHSGSGRMASPFPVGDFHLLFFASFPGALRSGSQASPAQQLPVRFPTSGLGDVPGAVQEPVAGGVAGLAVLREGVERFALVGPLRRAVVAGHHGPPRRSLGSRIRLQRGPVGGAWTVAGRLALHVLVEGVKRHAASVDEGLAFGG